MEIKLINARSRVTTQSDLHSGGGYTNTLARIESACTFKLFDVKHLVDKTIEFVHAFLENFETAKEVLRDSTRVVVVIVLVY